MFHMDLGLSRVGAAIAALGLDRPPYLGAQVVGTNGKGSTSTFLAEAFTAHGMRAGLYTSPHFLSPRERVLVDARFLPDSLWLAAAEAVLRVSLDRSESLRLTYFELLTVMAAWMFREAGCAACVFEAGLGGWHDATTALPGHVTLITPIGMDHAAVIGPELTDIARDKARAMRPDVPAACAAQEDAAMTVITVEAKRIGAPLFPADELRARFGDRWPDRAGMPGAHQMENLRLALGAYELLAEGHGLPVDPQALAKAAANAFIPGRFQMIAGEGGKPAVILDGAHNRPGLECLARALKELGVAPAAVVFACLADKDLDAMAGLVRGLADGPVIVPGVDAPGRSLEPSVIAAKIGGDVLTVPDAAAALEAALEAARAAAGARGGDGAGMGVEAGAAAQGAHAARASGAGGPGRSGRTAGPVLVCGSLYLLADVYALYPRWLERRPSGP
jgi:dihydrofolate synthase/folylpolyglutamate synthase